MHSITKRHMTLIEIMIVMILIAMITAVIAINYQGSLDEGRAFQTKASIDKIETILTLAVAEKGDLEEVMQNWQAYVRSSPLVKDANKIIYDGWGEIYEVKVEPRDDGTSKIIIRSRNLDAYEARKRGQ